MTNRWLLPEYVEDLLPPDAWRLEMARRAILDLFRERQFDLVLPPLMEYMESLQTGTGRDMDALIFRLVDQLNGRQLGIRADMTLQVARMDAHDLSHVGVNRLCYAGSVLHTRPAGHGQSREPYQVGAEIYGVSDLSADLDILSLMLEALHRIGLNTITLDVGHVAIFRTLAQQAGLNEKQETQWFEAMLQKDIPTLQQLAAPLDPPWRQALLALPELNGPTAMLDRAQAVLPHSQAMMQALEQLRTVARHLQQRVELTFDLAALQGYHYHSGLVFAVYAPGYADAVARGGRYDHIGRAFGRARAATGFSLDLRELLSSLT